MVEVKRYPRGVMTCPVGDHKLNSDLNGALNILRRGSGVLVRGNLRPLSFIVDHNGIALTNCIAYTKGITPKTLASIQLSQRSGKGL
ncbi:hypothetical protein [Conexivisphaera calida]|uniref:Transposase ISC1476 n=1 Tax=Conexivisphaera calida TaxID=1874277 RepID=A0A4P2VE65_9ARCH|nr:hypothetical protein [Conexivisphaera calida]BBE41693.1 Transposase ISC1476 [Conexivisphaera calida]